MTRVRFAPSNTGTLHLGGARTALYNWLVARRRKGTFVLRIEDTDLERSKPEYTDDILASLEWLGIDWDEGPKKGGPFGPYRQTERAAQGLYRPFVERLVAGGGVYRCFCTRERLVQLKATNENAPYDRRCRGLAPDEVERRARAGEASVIRLKLPEGGIAWDDGIAGRVAWKTDDMSDEVVIRADGSPMYNFVVVCDDLSMKITDVIRGADHMANTPKQLHIYDVLAAQRPTFSHIPLIFGPNGKKLSKRAPVSLVKTKTGEEAYAAQSKEDPDAFDLYHKGERSTAKKSEVHDLRQVLSQVSEYRDAGYLPEAVVNYVVLLGWGYDDKTEYFTKDELVEKFDLARVSTSPAQFDPVKLLAFQANYMKNLPDEQVARRYEVELARAGLLPATLSDDDRARLVLLARAEKERVRTFPEIVERARRYYAEDVAYDAKAQENLRKAPGTDAMLAAYRAALASASWDESSKLEVHAREHAKARGLKFGELVHPVRAALTGTTQGPGLFDVLRLVGRERALRRLATAEAFLRSGA